MNIKLVNRGTTGEFIVEGRLDSSTSPEAQKLLEGMVDRFDKMVLNFSGLQYVSSAGLRVLKNLHIAMKKKGGEFVVNNVSESVMEVFDLTGFSQVLNIE